MLKPLFEISFKA